MSGTQLGETLTSATDDVMTVDTSFLDAYRSGGSDGLKQLQDAQQVAADPEVELESQGDQTPSEITHDSDPDVDLDPEVDDDADFDRELEVDDERTETESGAGQRGGSSGSASAPEGPPAGGDRGAVPDLPEQAEVEVEELTAPPGRHDEVEAAEAERAVSLEHTDHQDAVQSATGVRGGGSSGGSLPATGFKLIGAKSQPTVRALPESMLVALREQLRRVAVRELGIAEAEARAFGKRLSQASLVTAFLMAHLDLDVDVDAATRRAGELFRCNDPLLGRAVERLDELTQRERAQGEEMGRMREEMAQVRSTAMVLEQMLSYSVADRAENLGRGTAGVDDLDLSHRSALKVRDNAREATRKQRKIERDRDGRPIR